MKLRYLLSWAALGVACENGPTDTIKLFSDDAAGTSSVGGANGGHHEAGGADGGRPDGGTTVGSGGTSRTASGGEDNHASFGGASAGSGDAASGGVNSALGGRTGQGGGCQSDADCAAPTPACNLSTHVCRICNKDSQCPSPQHCEVSEGHCE